jgi:NitT/TauT family transport system ATP-binding protein
MRQRVGFARALVVEPDALLMDEPFSALDVLTSENLRGELLRLWRDGDFPTRSALIVTHNIEEAIQLADRVLVLGSNPGRIKAELSVDLPQPRDKRSPAFEALVDTVYGILTGRDTEPRQHRVPTVEQSVDTELDTQLPHASTGALAGLIELLAARGGHEGLAEIADELRFEIDDLLPIVDAARLLRLATTEESGLHLTEQGRRYAARRSAPNSGRCTTTPRPARSSTPRSTGVGTPSCSSTTPTPTAWSCRRSLARTATERRVPRVWDA